MELALITIHREKETDFEKNGFGAIDNYIVNPEVDWEMNGKFQLSFAYPSFLEKSVYLKNKNIVRAPVPFMQDQLFRIYRTRKVLGFIEVEARHIFYDLLDNLIEDTNIVGKNGQVALQQLLGATQYPHRFMGLSDIETINSARMVRYNPIEALLDDSISNTFVRRWGGELVRDNFTIRMARQMGTNRGVHIQHKKDLTGYEATIDESTVVTRIMPIGFDGLKLPELYVDSPLIDLDNPKIHVIKYDNVKAAVGEYANDEDAIPIENAYNLLRQYANEEYSVNHLDEPETVVSVDFVTLHNTLEYKEFASLQEIQQGDVVKVSIPDEGFEITSRLVAFTSDPLQKNRYTSTTLGNHVFEFTTSDNEIVKIRNDVNTLQESVVTVMQAANGKNSNFSGTDDPNALNLNANLGDNYTRFVGEEKILYQYVELNGERYWAEITNTGDLDRVSREVQSALIDAQGAKQAAETAYSNAVSEAERLVDAQTAVFNAEMSIRQGEIQDAKTQADLAVGKANANAEAIFGKLDLATYEANKTAVETELGTKLATATYNAQKQTQDALIAGKVALTTYNAKMTSLDTAINGTSLRVDELEDGFALTATKTEVDSLKTRLNTAELNITATSNQLALKASQTDLNAATGRLTTAEGRITANANAIELRATKTDVNALTGRVTTAEGIITAQAGQIALRATTSTVNALTSRVSAAEASLSVQSGKIDLAATKSELTSAIDGIEVGGVNRALSPVELGYNIGPGLVSSNEYRTFKTAVLPIGEYIISHKTDMGVRLEPSANVTILDESGSYNFTEPFRIRVTTESMFNISMRRSDTSDLGDEYLTLDEMKFKIEKGNKTTDWTPAPEDVEDAISTVQSNLTVEAGKITALTTRVSGAESNITSVTQTVSGINTTISTLRTDVNGKATIVALNQVKSTADGNKTTITNHSGRLTTVETNVSGLQTTVADKISKAQFTVLSNSVSSVVSDLNNLEIGGRNLVKGNNGGLDKMYLYLSGGSATLIDEPLSPTGKAKKLTITSTASSRDIMYWTLQALVGDALMAGEVYTISFVAKASSNVVLASSSINQMSIVGGVFSETITTEYKKYSIKVIPQVDSSIAGNYNTHFKYPNSIPTGQALYIQYIKIEKGNKATDWSPAPEDVQSRITQLSTDINLRVTKGSLMSEINVQAGRTIISTGKLYLDTGSTIMTTAYVNDLKAKSLEAVTANITSIRSQVLVADSVTSTHVKADNAMIDNIFGTSALITRLTSKTAFINNIKAIDISADRITTGTLNAANVNIINLSVSQITGLNSSFIQSTWNGLNSSLSIDSAGLKSYSSRLETRLTAGYLRYYVDNAQIGYIAPLVSTVDTSNQAIGIVAPSGGNIILGRSVSNGIRESIHINGTNGYIGIKRPLDFSLDGVDVGRIYGDATNGLIISSSGAEIQFFQGGTSLMYGVAGGLRMYRQINMNQNPIDNVTSLFANEVATPTLRKVATLATDSTLSFTRAGVVYSQMLSGGFRMQIQLNMNTYDVTNVGKLTYSSDARYKSNIVTRDVSDLDIIRNIRYVDYTFDRDGSRQRGLIAQELMNADSKLVTTSENGYLSYDSQQYTHTIGHGLQELDGNVRDLRDGVLRTNKDFLSKIEELENKIKQLEEKIT